MIVRYFLIVVIVSRLLVFLKLIYWLSFLSLSWGLIIFFLYFFFLLYELFNLCLCLLHWSTWIIFTWLSLSRLCLLVLDLRNFVFNLGLNWFCSSSLASAQGLLLRFLVSLWVIWRIRLSHLAKILYLFWSEMKFLKLTHHVWLSLCLILFP
jgi:hypothetical protein